MKKAVKFNEKIALKVFQVLDYAWRNKIGILSDIVLPQDKGYSQEEWNSLSDKQKANFLFYGALPMRGGVVSDDAFKWMWALRRRYPEMFEPESISQWSIEKIITAFKTVSAELLNGVGTGETGYGALGYRADQHANHWLQNSVNLCKWWDGDVRNIFWGVTDFEEAFRMVNNKISYRKKHGACLFGMRRKIFSLFTIFLQEKGLIPIFPCPIPVDFHAMRILWSTEVISLDEWAIPFKSEIGNLKQLEGNLSLRIHEAVPDQIAIWSQKFLQKIGISHITINPALWILSRSLCAEHYQASAKDDGKTYFLADELEKNPSLWPTDYKNPCGHCFFESLCKWIISAAPYYGRFGKRKKGERDKEKVKGGFLIRLRRAHYHSPLLQGINWSEERFFRPKRQKRGSFSKQRR